MTKWKSMTKMPFTAAIDMGKAAVALAALFLLLHPMWTAYAQSQDTSLITASGIGHPPPDAVSPVQAKAMAERAALLQAIRNAARKAGRAAPENFMGTVQVGATVQGFRVMRITALPDGSIEVEVSVPPAGVSP